jgi:hypothetical protein
MPPTAMNPRAMLKGNMVSNITVSHGGCYATFVTVGVFRRNRGIYLVSRQARKVVHRVTGFQPRLDNRRALGERRGD